MFKKFLSFFKKGLSATADALFAPYLKCIICGRETTEPLESGFCKTCDTKNPLITTPCKKCGAFMPNENQYCPRCKNTKHQFDRVVSAYVFDDDIVKLMYKFKYGDAQYLATYFARPMYKAFANSGLEVDIVTYVPLCTKRQKKRGYNQAKLLAKEFCKLSGLPLIENNLVRIKETDYLAKTKTRKERQESLDKAFVTIDKTAFADKSILVIDDVITSGATINEISKTLKKAKAKNIYGLTVANTKINVHGEKN